MLKRVVSAVLVLSFGFTELSFAAPSLSFTSPILQNPSQLKIDASAGRLDETLPGTGSKLVIHIQDAHTNSSAQRNIARILENLVTNYGVKTVYSEGGVGENSLAAFRSFASKEKREKIASKYLMRGQLSGAEYLSLASDLNFEIKGIEDWNLYLQGLQSYASTVSRRDAVLTYLNGLDKTTGSLKRKFYGKSLLELDEFSRRYSNKTEDFSVYYQKLSASAQEAGVSLLGYPNFISLKNLKSKEEKINFEKASAEQQDLAKLLTEKGYDFTDAATIEKFRSESASPLAFYHSLFEAAQKTGTDLNRFSDLLSYVDYVKTFASVDPMKLVSEMQSLEEVIYSHSLESQDAMRLHAIDRYLASLKKLFLLQLSAEEFAQIENDAHSVMFQPIVLSAFLNRKLYDLGRYEQVVKFSDVLDQNISEAIEFYRSAQARDEAFMKNIQAGMQNEKVAVVVTGGFHTANLKNHIRQAGFSYASVTPFLNHETNTARYEKLLLSNVSSNGNSNAQAHALPLAYTAMVARMPLAPGEEYVYKQIGGDFKEFLAAARVASGSEDEDSALLLKSLQSGNNLRQSAPAAARLTEEEDYLAGMESGHIKMEGYETPAESQASPAPVDSIATSSVVTDIHAKEPEAEAEAADSEEQPVVIAAPETLSFETAVPETPAETEPAVFVPAAVQPTTRTILFETLGSEIQSASAAYREALELYDQFEFGSDEHEMALERAETELTALVRALSQAQVDGQKLTLDEILSVESQIRGDKNFPGDHGNARSVISNMLGARFALQNFKEADIQAVLKALDFIVANKEYSKSRADRKDVDVARIREQAPGQAAKLQAFKISHPGLLEAVLTSLDRPEIYPYLKDISNSRFGSFAQELRSQIGVEEGEPSAASAMLSGGARLVTVSAQDLQTRIEFGTSGWRTDTKSGFTLGNVSRVAQAFANWLASDQKEINELSARVAVGYDARPGARDFAQRMVEVLCANGISADLIDQVTPTPVMAEATRENMPKAQRYDVAFHLTASHNSIFKDLTPDSAMWQGIKVLRNGVPASDAFTANIANAANDASKNGEYKMTPYNLIAPIFSRRGVDLLGSSDERLKKVFDFDAISKALSSRGRFVVIDSMHGATGQAAKVLESLGVVREYLRTTPMSEELERGTLTLSVEDPQSKKLTPWRPEPQPFLHPELTAKTVAGTFGTALDGDGDRAAFMDYVGDKMKALTPNELGLIFAHYLYSKGERGVVVRTIPTTHTLDRFAAKKGLNLKETPVGSKWFEPYAVEGSAEEKLLVGIEESGHIFFKYKGEIFVDSAVAEVLLAIEIMANTGKSLSQYLAEVQKEVGELYYERTAIDSSLVHGSFLTRLRQLRVDASFPNLFVNELARASGKKLKKAEGAIKEGVTYDLRDKAGIKVNFADGTWAMYRISGTDGSVRIYAEDETPDALKSLIKAASDTVVKAVSGARMATAAEIESGVDYWQGRLATTPITRPFRASRENDVKDVNALSDEEALRYEKIGLEALNRGEGYISMLIAGASSRMNTLEAPEDVKKMVGGHEILSKAAVPVGVKNGRVITYLGAFGENVSRLFRTVEEESKKAGIASRVWNNLIGLMTNDEYVNEHRRLLDENSSYGLNPAQISFFNQPLGAKYVATPADVESIKKSFKTEADYQAALAYSKEVEKKLAAGDKSAVILEDEKDPLGHGEYFHQLIASGELLRMIDAGKKWGFVKNVDNYASKFDKVWLRTLGLFLAKKLDFQPEVSPRAPGQKGGSLIVMEDNGAHQLAEDPNIKKTNEVRGKKVMDPTDSFWFNDAVAFYTVAYVINLYKQNGQSDEQFIAELRAANADGRQAIAERGRKKFPKILDVKPAKRTKAAITKSETNLWQSSGLVGPEMKIEAVGVKGARNLPIEEYLKMNKAERRAWLAKLRFLSTKNWTKNAKEVADAREAMEKAVGRPVTDNELWITLETYQGNKIIADDLLDYLAEEELVTPGILAHSAARLAADQRVMAAISTRAEALRTDKEDRQIAVEIIQTTIGRIVDGVLADTIRVALGKAYSARSASENMMVDEVFGPRFRGTRLKNAASYLLDHHFEMMREEKVTAGTMRGIFDYFTRAMLKKGTHDLAETVELRAPYGHPLFSMDGTKITSLSQYPALEEEADLLSAGAFRQNFELVKETAGRSNELYFIRPIATKAGARMAEAPKSGGFLLNGGNPAELKPTSPFYENDEVAYFPEDMAKQGMLSEYLATARKIIADKLVPMRDKINNGKVDVKEEIVPILAEQGWMGMNVPEEFGGSEFPKVLSAGIQREIARAGMASLVSLVRVHNGVSTRPIVYFGTDAQKQKYLPKLAKGEWIGAYCSTEPNHGSDVFNPATKLDTTYVAVEEGGKPFYRISGAKIFITNGPYADTFIVYACDPKPVKSTIKGADGKEKEVLSYTKTAFIVDRNLVSAAGEENMGERNPKITIGKKADLISLKGSATVEVAFDDVLVPAENILGKLGDAPKIAQSAFNDGRSSIQALVTGMAEATRDVTVSYVKDRKQFGKALAQIDDVKLKIAELEAGVYAMETLYQRMVSLFDGGLKEPGIEATLGKTFTSEWIKRLTDIAMQLHGGYGVDREYLVAVLRADSDVTTIYEGANPVLLTNVIGVEALKYLNTEVWGKQLSLLQNWNAPEAAELSEEVAAVKRAANLVENRAKEMLAAQPGATFKEKTDALKNPKIQSELQDWSRAMSELYLMLAVVNRTGEMIKRGEEAKTLTPKIKMTQFLVEESMARLQKILNDGKNRDRQREIGASALEGARLAAYENVVEAFGGDSTAADVDIALRAKAIIAAKEQIGQTIAPEAAREQAIARLAFDYKHRPVENVFPGINFKFMVKAAQAGMLAPRLVLDLEDSVSTEMKDKGRDVLIRLVKLFRGQTVTQADIDLVKKDGLMANDIEKSLIKVDGGFQLKPELRFHAEQQIVIRPNNLRTKWAAGDYAYMIPQIAEFIDGVYMPKVEDASDVRVAVSILRAIQRRKGLAQGYHKIYVLTELPPAVAQADRILKIAPEVEEVQLGVVDYTAATGGMNQVQYEQFKYMRYALLRLPEVGKANGKIAGTGITVNLEAEETKADAIKMAALGFNVKWSVNPAHLEGMKTLHGNFPRVLRRVADYDIPTDYDMAKLEEMGKASQPVLKPTPLKLKTEVVFSRSIVKVSASNKAEIEKAFQASPDSLVVDIAGASITEFGNLISLIRASKNTRVYVVADKNKPNVLDGLTALIEELGTDASKVQGLYLQNFETAADIRALETEVAKAETSAGLTNGRIKFTLEIGKKETLDNEVLAFENVGIETVLASTPRIRQAVMNLSEQLPVEAEDDSKTRGYNYYHSFFINHTAMLDIEAIDGYSRAENFEDETNSSAVWGFEGKLVSVEQVARTNEMMKPQHATEIPVFGLDEAGRKAEGTWRRGPAFTAFRNTWRNSIERSLIVIERFAIADNIEGLGAVGFRDPYTGSNEIVDAATARIPLRTLDKAKALGLLTASQLERFNKARKTLVYALELKDASKAGVAFAQEKREGYKLTFEANQHMASVSGDRNSHHLDREWAKKNLKKEDTNPEGRPIAHGIGSGLRAIAQIQKEYPDFKVTDWKSNFSAMIVEGAEVEAPELLTLSETEDRIVLSFTVYVNYMGKRTAAVSGQVTLERRKQAAASTAISAEDAARNLAAAQEKSKTVQAFPKRDIIWFEVGQKGSVSWPVSAMGNGIVDGVTADHLASAAALEGASEATPEIFASNVIAFASSTVAPVAILIEAGVREFGVPVKEGDKVAINWEATDVYQTPNKSKAGMHINFLNLEFTCRNQRGELVVRGYIKKRADVQRPAVYQATVTQEQVDAAAALFRQGTGRDVFAQEAILADLVSASYGSPDQPKSFGGKNPGSIYMSQSYGPANPNWTKFIGQSWTVQETPKTFYQMKDNKAQVTLDVKIVAQDGTVLQQGESTLLINVPVELWKTLLPAPKKAEAATKAVIEEEAKPVVDQLAGTMQPGDLIPIGKGIYANGKLTGPLPKYTRAWGVRKNEHGLPGKAIVETIEAIPAVGENDVLVEVKAVSLNFNGSWAAQGMPVSPFTFPRIKLKDFQTLGSDASGIVVAVGSKVTRWKLGDEVIMSCGEDDKVERTPSGADNMEKRTFAITGYETADGTFRQYTVLSDRQLHPKPAHLSWEDASSYGLVGATAWRDVKYKAKLKAGETILVWGAWGGTGIYAVQSAKVIGAKNIIAVVSSEDKGREAMKYGATGFLNRKDFGDIWGVIPTDAEAQAKWREGATQFVDAFKKLTGGELADVVIEHPGADTYPISVELLKDSGRVTHFAGTTGYKMSFIGKEWDPAQTAESILAEAGLNKGGQKVVIYGSDAVAKTAFDLAAKNGAQVGFILNDEAEYQKVLAWDTEKKVIRGWAKISDIPVPQDMPEPPHPDVPNEKTAAYETYRKNVLDPVRDRVRKIFDGAFPDIIVERAANVGTLDVSAFTVRPHGAVVYLESTAGKRLVYDARFVWMFQKKILPTVVGTHYASYEQAEEFNQAIIDGQIRIVPSQVFAWSDLPKAQQTMLDNRLKQPKASILVGAPSAGLTGVPAESIFDASSQTPAQAPIAFRRSQDFEITADLLDQFIAVSGDNNAVHRDAKAAATALKGVKNRIAHGKLVFSVIRGLLADSGWLENAQVTAQSIQFVAPVEMGDKVRAEIAVTSARVEKGEAVITISVRALSNKPGSSYYNEAVMGTITLTKPVSVPVAATPAPIAPEAKGPVNGARLVSALGSDLRARFSVERGLVQNATHASEASQLVVDVFDIRRTGNDRESFTVDTRELRLNTAQRYEIPLNVDSLARTVSVDIPVSLNQVRQDLRDTQTASAQSQALVEAAQTTPATLTIGSSSIHSVIQASFTGASQILSGLDSVHNGRGSNEWNRQLQGYTQTVKNGGAGSVTTFVIEPEVIADSVATPQGIQILSNGLENAGKQQGHIEILVPGQGLSEKTRTLIEGLDTASVEVSVLPDSPTLLGSVGAYHAQRGIQDSQVQNVVLTARLSTLTQNSAKVGRRALSKKLREQLRFVAVENNQTTNPTMVDGPMVLLASLAQVSRFAISPAFTVNTGDISITMDGELITGVAVLRLVVNRALENARMSKLAEISA